MDCINIGPLLFYKVLYITSKPSYADGRSSSYHKRRHLLIWSDNLLYALTHTDPLTTHLPPEPALSSIKPLFIFSPTCQKIPTTPASNLATLRGQTAFCVLWKVDLNHEGSVVSDN